jgi:hypothetical protein
VIAKFKAQNEIGWSFYSTESNNDVLVVQLPHDLVQGPIRDQAGSSLTGIKMIMPLIEGEATGGLPILSYGMETSQDQITWTPLCGFASDYSETYFVHSGLTTGEGWYYRYSIKNSVGWSNPSPVTHSMVGTEPAQMTAPEVTIDTDPMLVKISWLQLSAAIDGGLPLSQYIV